MARYKRKKSHRSGSKKLPMAVAVPLAYTGYNMAKQFMGGNTAYPVYALTGMTANGDFQGAQIVRTYVPILAGVVAHKAASRLGVNRMIPKWIPFSI